MFVDILKAFIVGVGASVPIGPIAIFVIQCTFCKGFKAGFVASLGSTVVDTIYAVIAIFALAFVQDFIAGSNSIPLFIVGGLVVMALGLSMTLSNPFRKMKRAGAVKTCSTDGETCSDPYGPGQDLCNIAPSTTDFLSACAMGLSNPGAIAVLFALMAFFGIAEQPPTNWSFFPIIIGVAAGSASYWLGMTLLLNKFRKQFNMKTIIWINRITGAIVIVLGLATLAEGLMRIFVK